MTPAQVLREKLGTIGGRVEDGYVDTVIYEDIPALLDVVEGLLAELEWTKDRMQKAISQAAERLNEGRENG